MFALVLWFWVNLFVTLVDKLEIKIIPQNKVLKVLMYITFPLLLAVEFLPIFIGKLYQTRFKGSIDRLSIRFINLIDKMNGTYGSLSTEQIDYIKNDSIKPYGKRYKGGR